MQRYLERHESLWMLTAAPTIWAAHFLLSYLTAAIWCAKAAGPDAGLGDVRTAIGLYTAAALGGIAIVGLAGWRRQEFITLDTPPDEIEAGRDTAEDRHQFLAFSTVLLSALSAVATIYVALAAVFIENCR
jgi:hypothetical protein